MYQFSRMHS